MTGLAEWLVVLAALSPIAGAALGLIVAGSQRLRAGVASGVVNAGVLCSFLSTVCLAALIWSGNLETISVSAGVWFEFSGNRQWPIEWGWQVDSSASIWLVVMTGLGWLTISLSRNTPHASSATGLGVCTALVLAAAVGFVLSTGMVQMLACWSALSLTTLAMVGWTSSSVAGIQGMRRTVQAGLPSDLLLFWAVLLIGLAGGTDSIAATTAADGLSRMSVGNVAIPGLIGCLLVLSTLGRCGVFPVFGWHNEAAAWNLRQCIVIYGIGYVPSGVWLLLKCQPLLATADVALLLLGGLGTLGAILGAFVACGQDDPHRRLGYLAASQSGIMLAALGSGLHQSVVSCATHQCLISLAFVVLFAVRHADISKQRTLRAGAWCAGLALAGLFPFGGWTQRELIELNAFPASSRLTEIAETKDAADATRPTNSASETRAPTAPRWGWICGLWVAQGLSAFAVIRLVRPCGGPADDGSLGRLAIPLAGGLLLVAGVGGWIWHAVTTTADPDQLVRLVIGQTVIIAGLGAGWSTQRASERSSGLASHNPWESIHRLSQQRLYVDQAIGQLLLAPSVVIRHLFGHDPGPNANDRFWTRTVARGVEWLGNQVELLHVGRADFYVATILIGTFTLLLTLILVT